MMKRPESIETLVNQLLPAFNPDRQQRNRAWDIWHKHPEGGCALRAFIEWKNYSPEPHDDIYQDTVVATVCAVEKGRYVHRSKDEFMGYMEHIAVNKMCAAQRRSKLLKSVEVVEQRAEGSERALERSLLWQEEQARLDRAIACLPEKQQQAFRLRLANCSYTEIAEILDSSEAAARKNSSRAVRRIRELLDSNL